MSKKLAILVPTLVERRELRNRMTDALQKQMEEIGVVSKIVILINEDNREKTTGQKRNELVQLAVDIDAEYIAFFDDDDMPGETYIKSVCLGMGTGADCCSLWGQIYWDGKKGKPFHHSIVHKEWSEDEKYYYRCPNHLNAIKLSLVKDVKFPEQNFGEDGQWSMKVKELGLLKTEAMLTDIIYHYFCGNPKQAL